MADDCRNLGASAIAIPTNVNDADAMHNLAQRARNELGRIDIWLNNAAVTAFGIFEETPPERRIGGLVRHGKTRSGRVCGQLRW